MGTFKITFLGTGTTIPTVQRRHSSIHLIYQSKNTYSMLFDCGESVQTRLQKTGINFMSIDHIFISHWHADHFIGLFGLLTSMGFEGKNNELKIFGPKASKIGPELLKFFKLPFKIKFVDCKEGKIFENDEIFVEATKMKHTIENFAYAVQEKDRIKLNKIKIKKFKLNWRECKEIKEKGKIKKNGKTIKLEQVSDKITGKRVVYSGDTIYLKKMEKFSKDSILIHDCTYFDRKDLKHKYHSTLEDVLKLRKSAKEIYLTHISRKYINHKELEKKVSRYKNIFVAKDLMKIKI
jgi:ribonuclease Z